MSAKMFSAHAECPGCHTSLPDPLLLGLLQLGVPPQHRHDRLLLLLRQVAQVDHGSSSWFSQRADAGNTQQLQTATSCETKSHRHILQRHVFTHCSCVLQPC